MHHQRRPTSTAKVDFSSPPKRHKNVPVTVTLDDDDDDTFDFVLDLFDGK